MEEERQTSDYREWQSADIGDNIGFGGKVSTNFHEDFVVFSPTVVLWKKKGKQAIIKSGQSLI